MAIIIKKLPRVQMVLIVNKNKSVISLHKTSNKTEQLFFFFASILLHLGASQLLPEVSNLLDPLHLKYLLHFLISLSHLSLGPSTVVLVFPRVIFYLAC